MKCTAFRAFERNSLRGFATIGLVLLDVALHERDGKKWASPPGRPMVDKERRIVTDDAGKVRYAQTVEFRDDRTRFRWSAELVAAIADYQSKAPDSSSGAMSGGRTPEAAGQERRDEF
jgi:hypothetical protein